MGLRISSRVSILPLQLLQPIVLLLAIKTLQVYRSTLCLHDYIVRTTTRFILSGARATRFQPQHADITVNGPPLTPGSNAPMRFLVTTISHLWQCSCCKPVSSCYKDCQKAHWNARKYTFFSVHECGNELSPSAREHDKISQGCRIGEEALRELSENSFVYDCYRETSFQGAITVFPEDQ